LANKKDITLRPGAASPSDVSLYPLPSVERVATPIYLYAGRTPASDITLRDPATLVISGALGTLSAALGALTASADGSVTGAGAVSGALSATLGALSVTAHGAVAVSGTSNATLGALSIVANGAVIDPAGAVAPKFGGWGAGLRGPRRAHTHPPTPLSRIRKLSERDRLEAAPLNQHAIDADDYEGIALALICAAEYGLLHDRLCDPQRPIG
jgi:hypothetical protein